MRQQHRFKRHFRVSLALHVAVIFFSHFSFAQTYPVSATLQLTPPYSVYLSDYTVNDQMKLHLLLRDLSEPSYQVRLSLVLEGVGIRIETNPNSVPPPIFIEGGIPTPLSAEDLAPYLDTRNLIFSGITRQEYEQRAALPEGFYRFCFRVYDYKRKDVLLSQEACAQAWFMLNDPPRINTPLCGSTLPVRDPQNILFQWLPMNANSPNSAFTTEYEFTLVEIRPPGRNPNDAINVGYPLFQTTTQQTSLIYGLLEPPLIPGLEYAFRVRAIDTEGRDQFKNRGYSEVCTFKFGDTNGVPPLEGMNVYVEGERRAKVTWFVNTETDKYRVEYRKKSSTTNYTWFTIETEQDNTLIQDLEPDTEYEVRVAGILRNQMGSYSPTKLFRTNPAREYSCGQSVESIVTTNTNPLLHGMVGQIWKLDLFEMIVLEVSGGNGTFSGFGAVRVPFWGVKFYCHFENVKVNEKQELIAGEVLTVKGDVEALKKRLVDLNEQKKRDKAKSSGYSFEGVDIKFEGTIDSLYVNEEGEVIAVVASNENSTNGSSKKEERKIDTKKGADNRITDDSGNVYVVNKDGTIEKMGSTGASGTTAVASNVNYRVDFESSSNQAYGFDQQQHSEHERNYEKYERDGKIYTISWKSVASGSTDVVIAKSTESRKDFLKEVIYKTDNGLLLRKPGNQENEVQLTVEGFGDQSTEQVTAYYKRKEADGKEKEVMAGKLNVVSYDKLVERLVIVSVNNTALNISTTELAESLNTIFAPAAVEWTVESQSIDLNYDTNGKSGLDDGSSGIFSNYTGEMRSIINAYKDKYDIAKNTWYLFLIPNSESGRTQGFMPRKKQAGFIFMEQLGEALLAKVIAHEIGHGAFRLEHSFDTYNTLAKSSTDNLMDYQPNGITLHKYQWDLIHDPTAVLGLFEGDEGGAMVAKKTTGKLVVTISNTTLTEGKVYVNESSTKQIKLKFEIADTTKTKVLYQLTCVTSSKNTTINYPKTGYDTLVYNQVEEINFDTIPQGKYKLVCKVSKKDYVLNFIVRNKKLEITSKQLKAIFPTTDDKRIAEVVKAVNEYSAAFDISTPERMAHFIGQIGAETGGLKQLKESYLYTPRTILKIFPFVKYGHLFEIVGLDSNSYVYKYSSINYDENKCDGKKIDRGNAVFPLKNDSEILNAYATTKSDTLEVLIDGKKSKILIYKTRTDVTTENIEQEVKDAEYNNGILKVKAKYIRSSALFDVTYACRMENGNVASKDGSTYLGKGFIHITGKGGYREVSEEWNKLYPNDKKEFHGKDITLLETNVEMAIKASMVYWKLKNLNAEAEAVTDNDINDVGSIVNGTNPPTGAEHRKLYTKSAYKNIR